MAYRSPVKIRAPRKESKNKLRSLRLVNMCSMSEAAKAVGISMSTLQRYEADGYDVTKIKLSNLQKFARLYGVPLRYLTDHNEIALRDEDFKYNLEDENPLYNDIAKFHALKSDEPEREPALGSDGNRVTLEALTDSFSLVTELCKLTEENRDTIKAMIQAFLREQNIERKEDE